MTTTPESVEFRAQAMRAVTITEDWLTRILRGAGFVLWEAITVGNEFGNPTGTPKDIGMAVNSWWVKVGQTGDAGTHPNPPVKPPAGQKLNMRAAFDVAAVSIAGAKLGDIIVFANGAAYILKLEYQGHSKQAPNGFVRLPASQWQAIVNSVAAAAEQAAGGTGGATGGGIWGTA